MRRGWRIAAIGGSVLAVGVLALVARTLNTAGLFSSVVPGFAGTCQTVRGVVGAEDIAVDRRTGLAFLSATDRWARDAGRPAPQDGLYVMALDHPELGVRKLAGTPGDFHPHGISLYRAPDGALTLMAVNHRTNGTSSIDIFAVHERPQTDDMPDAMLTETASVQSSLLVRPNDVVATGPDRFYATNSRTSTTQLGRMLELWLQVPRADVVYYDGQRMRVAATGLRFANGLVLSADGRKLYVAETLGRDIRTYDVQPLSKRLTLAGTFALPAGLDNLDLDAAGNLWVAGHPKLFAYAHYATHPADPSPSEVFRVTLKNGMPNAFTAVYAGLGKRIGAASVGVHADGQLLIGSVFDDHVLDCTPR